MISGASALAAPQGPSVIGKTTHQGGDGKPLSKLAAPGLYPGRVVEVKNPRMIHDGTRDREAIKASIDPGIKTLTGATDAVEGWKHFFEPGDVVGIKVVPNGQPHAHSSFEIVLEVIEKLKTCGVKSRDIFVYDRYRGEFMDAGYHKILPADIRWGGLDPDGEPVRARLPRLPRSDPIAGFDHDTFVWMDLIPYGDDPKDESMYRSHLGKLVTKTLNKIVAIPVLKDHGSAGVTGRPQEHEPWDGQQRGPLAPYAFTNVCNQFIPQMVSHPIIREKFVLQIMDGIRGVYQGGPFGLGRRQVDLGVQRHPLRDRPGCAGPRRVGHHRRQAEEQTPARRGRRQGGARPLEEGRLRRPPAAAHRPGRCAGPGPLRLQVEQGPAVLDRSPGRRQSEPVMRP